MVVSVAECSYVSVTEAASTSSTTSLEERRTLQMRREQEMLARRREETRYCQNYNFISNRFELVCEVFVLSLSFFFAIQFNVASGELKLPKTVPPKMEVEGGQQTAPRRPPETRPGDEPRL